MQNGRKVIPLACAGRKLTGPPEGYDSRKAAQVKEWIQQIPPNDVLEHEVEHKSIVFVKNDDHKSQKAYDAEQETEKAPSDHTQNEELRSVQQTEFPDDEKKSEEHTSRQEVGTSLEEDTSDSSPATTHEVKTESHAHCWKCGSLLEQLVLEKKRNEELEAQLKQQEIIVQESKDEVQKLTNSISEISLRFSEKLIHEKESNQSSQSILNKEKQQKEQLQKTNEKLLWECKMLKQQLQKLQRIVQFGTS